MKADRAHTASTQWGFRFTKQPPVLVARLETTGSSAAAQHTGGNAGSPPIVFAQVQLTHARLPISSVATSAGQHLRPVVRLRVAQGDVPDSMLQRFELLDFEWGASAMNATGVINLNFRVVSPQSAPLDFALPPLCLEVGFAEPQDASDQAEQARERSPAGGTPPADPRTHKATPNQGATAEEEHSPPTQVLGNSAASDTSGAEHCIGEPGSRRESKRPRRTRQLLNVSDMRESVGAWTTHWSLDDPPAVKALHNLSNVTARSEPFFVVTTALCVERAIFHPAQPQAADAPEASSEATSIAEMETVLSLRNLENGALVLGQSITVGATVHYKSGIPATDYRAQCSGSISPETGCGVVRVSLVSGTEQIPCHHAPDLAVFFRPAARELNGKVPLACSGGASPREVVDGERTHVAGVLCEVARQADAAQQTPKSIARRSDSPLAWEPLMQSLTAHPLPQGFSTVTAVMTPLPHATPHMTSLAGPLDLSRDGLSGTVFDVLSPVPGTLATPGLHIPFESTQSPYGMGDNAVPRNWQTFSPLPPPPPPPPPPPQLPPSRPATLAVHATDETTQEAHTRHKKRTFARSETPPRSNTTYARQPARDAASAQLGSLIVLCEQLIGLAEDLQVQQQRRKPGKRAKELVRV